MSFHDVTCFGSFGDNDYEMLMRNISAVNLWDRCAFSNSMLASKSKLVKKGRQNKCKELGLK
jgi:hypothetical protein